MNRARPPFGRLLYGEIHGMIESFVASVHGESTVEEISGATSISAVDMHHAISDMASCGLCSVADGTVRLTAPSPQLAALIVQR